MRGPAGDAAVLSPGFARCWRTVQTERILGPEFRELSMGMSNDFEVAIEEVPLWFGSETSLFEGLQ